MPEFQGFDFGKVALSGFLQGREQAQRERQFLMDYARGERQDSLMNMIRERQLVLEEANLDLAKQRTATDQYQAETSRTNTKVNIAENFDIVPTNKFAPYAGVSTTLPTNAIEGGSLLKDLSGNYLIPKQKAMSGDMFETISTNAQGIGEYKGQKVDILRNKFTGEERQVPKAEGEDSLSNFLRWMAFKDEQGKKDALIEKKQGIYNKAMGMTWVPESKDAKGNTIAGHYEDDKFNSYTENQVRDMAIQQAAISGIPGEINKWGRLRESKQTNTYNQNEYEEKTGKKIFTKGEMIADFIKEEKRKPTERELEELKAQGLWK